MSLRMLILLLLSLWMAPSRADCIDDAAAYHSVNSLILRAISQVESSQGRNAGVRHNKNGSVDVGMMQTNSVHFPELAKFGISPNHLMNSCVSTYVAAWQLRKKIEKHGNTWKAVGAYHSETPKYRDPYAAKVRSIVESWTHAQ